MPRCLSKFAFHSLQAHVSLGAKTSRRNLKLTERLYEYSSLHISMTLDDKNSYVHGGKTFFKNGKEHSFQYLSNVDNFHISDQLSRGHRSQSGRAIRSGSPERLHNSPKRIGQDKSLFLANFILNPPKKRCTTKRAVRVFSGVAEPLSCCSSQSLRV